MIAPFIIIGINMNTEILSITAAFVASNYVYVWLADKSMTTAHERSYFQTILGLFLAFTC